MQWTGWVRGWTQSEVRNLHRTPAGACGTQECAAHGARAILAEPEHPAGLLSPSPHRHSHSELIKTEEVAHRALNLAQKSKPTSRSQGVDCFSSLCHCCWRGRIWVCFFFLVSAMFDAWGKTAGTEHTGSDAKRNGMLGNMDCTVYLKRSEFSLGQCWRNAVSIPISASRAFRRSAGSREEERSFS